MQLLAAFYIYIYIHICFIAPREPSPRPPLPWINTLFDYDDDVLPDIQLLQPVDELSLSPETCVSSNLKWFVAKS